MKKNIGIICGGYTSEQEISKKSGKVVFDSIQALDYFSYLIDLDKNTSSVVDQKGDTYPLNEVTFSFEKEGETVHFDMIINMIHGAPGENGILAEKFENLGITHSSCHPVQAALTYDKYACLEAVSKLGIPTAKRLRLKISDTPDIDGIIEQLGIPCFVKANRSGSSFGVYKVNDKKGLSVAISNAFKEDDELVIERALEGREITVGVLEWKGKLTVLPITEVTTENDFFDYEAKYEGKSEEITPAKIPIEWKEKAEEMAKKIYKGLHLSGITRSEFIFQEGIPHFLEVNTIPGMTKESIIPQQAKAAGISLPELLEGVIQTGLIKKV